MTWKRIYFGVGTQRAGGFFRCAGISLTEKIRYHTGVGIISMEKIFHRRRPRGDFLDGKDLTPRARAREKGELFRWKISVTARAGGGDFYRKSS